MTYEELREKLRIIDANASEEIRFNALIGYYADAMEIRLKTYDKLIAICDRELKYSLFNTKDLIKLLDYRDFLEDSKKKFISKCDKFFEVE